ncbi:formiminoglutamase [Haladaptatus litoreus]|uniref:Formimidoylglutamase n=1 Tax=Haladaptatus litoreus TaxID=553468 RepID=A0A1N7BTZ7_9EURY|nr:formimidoylglutamase [Haladaptatus litoreus]SIR54664.1 formiminoglutamase [Haladaptatus litoreus]
MSDFIHTFDWDGTSADPNDEQFGDVVEPATTDTADEFDAVLVGEPYDGAVIGRKGASGGPTALREQLSGIKTHHFDAGPVQSVGDLGDVANLEDTEWVEEAQSLAHTAASKIHEESVFPVFLGGDNSLTYANAVHLLTEDSSLGVINFDAHLDVREVRDSPTSGTPYRQLLDSDLGGGLASYACVGARHFETSTDYAQFVREEGGEIVTAEEVGEDSVSAIDTALESMGDVDTVYVSVDLDVLDAAFAPGVSAPTPGGITTRELFRMLRLVASDPRVAGFEIVECAPSLDQNELTVKAGARAIAHFLSTLGGGR